jgi:hypothetical protein
MGFKEQVAGDINTVFLNPSEFADTHIVKINGVEVRAVVDDDVLSDDSSIQGIYTGLKRVFINADSIPGRITAKARMEINGLPYIVQNCGEEMGVYVLTVSANRT